jgi:hypothetical protein
VNRGDPVESGFHGRRCFGDRFDGRRKIDVGADQIRFGWGIGWWSGFFRQERRVADRIPLSLHLEGWLGRGFDR